MPRTRGDPIGDGVEIRLGLPDRYRHQAAEICYEAFRRKLAPFVSKAHAIAVIEEDWVAEHTLVALCGDQLVGVAGLFYDGQDFFRPRLATLVGQFGWLRGMIALWGLRVFFASHPRRDDICVGGLAVHPAMRGQGIGTRLLQAVFTFARERGFRTVSLEVVDTNPRARQLYERLGFVAVKTVRIPFLRWLMGFSASIMMIRKVPRDEFQG